MRISEQQRFPPITVTLNDKGSVVIRFLAVEDARAYGDFYQSIERAAYRFYCPHPLTRENAEKRTAAALSPTVVGLVMVDAAQHIVAYASYQWNVSDNSPSFFGICIQKPYRGMGLGEILMQRIAEIAKDIGPPIMSLTVQKANPRAVALYRKMGFEIISKQMRAQVEEFPPEPEYYMERRVR
jgi:ribosomal protein S18 acetylase RimI-like enzyme